MHYSLSFMKHSFNYSYFLEGDGNVMSIDERIEETLELLVSSSDFIEFEDGTQCRNEDDLREVLRERGIL